MIRKVYSCDWCHVDAPNADSVPSEWRVDTNEKVGDQPTILCASCKGRRADAIESVRRAIHQESVLERKRT